MEQLQTMASNWKRVNYISKNFEITFLNNHALYFSFNTGVMLLDINKLNNHNWTMLWRLTAAQYLGTYGSTGLADQDILNAIIKNNPQFLFRLPCFWNVQLGDNTLSGSCYHDVIDIKV